MKVAIIGGGISGLTAARELFEDYEVTLFEAAAEVGGHSRTVDVTAGDGTSLAVDTGFIVFNRETYPGFCRMLEVLSIEPQLSDMSFSMSNLSTGVEYRATSLSTMFAQKRNFLRPSFLAMVRDILRFNEVAEVGLGPDWKDRPLSEFTAEMRFSQPFLRDYLLPMGAAIWSTAPSSVLEFPIHFLLRFFDNHGLLTVDGQPEWLTVPGGARTYVEALTRPFRDRIETGVRVERVSRSRAGPVTLSGSAGDLGDYDRAILAVHADQALGMLEEGGRNGDERYRGVLGALPYQENRGVLHSDERWLPKARRARASWNYRFDPSQADCATLTYDLTRLQSLGGRKRMLLTINPAAEAPISEVHGRFDYAHPGYTLASATAQESWAAIDGRRGVHFCGAYWGYGFHEDGLQSGLRVARAVREAES